MSCILVCFTIGKGRNCTTYFQTVFFHQDIAALSLNAYVHFWDARTFTQISSRKLQNPRENVCMGLSKKRNLYAIGAQAYVTVIDPRDSKQKRIISKPHGCGEIRVLLDSLDIEDQFLKRQHYYPNLSCFYALTCMITILPITISINL